MIRVFLLTAAICLSSFVFAQSPVGDGGKQVNFGLGLYSSSVPVYVGMDFGVHPDITVGPQIGFDLGLNYMAISGRGDYHFNTLLDLPRDWNVYAGANIGFVAGFDNDYDSELDLGLQIGGRYYWNSSWAINLEFGGGPAFTGGRLGVSKLL
jgi:hypothetical protein